MVKKLFCILSVLTVLAVFSSFTDASSDSGNKRKAFISSHFHFDPIWTNSQAGEALRAFAVVNQQLEYAEIEPRFKFILSEMDYLKPYWDAYPEKRATIKELAGAGRVEFTGGYNEPDESETGGEALIRNFVYGKLYKESQFGTHVQTAAQHDVFGHAVQLPQILLGSGHEYAMFMRGNLIDVPYEFNWLAPDGSSIPTKQIVYNGNALNASFSSNDSNYYGLTKNELFMSGGDFTEPDRSIGMRLGKRGNATIVSGTFADYFQAMENDIKASGITVPEISRDQNPIFHGCYTSRIDTKLANRIDENLLVDAEKFSTINSMVNGAAYPWLELDRAWRLLFFGEHHDGLTGSDNANVNLDLLAGWHESVQIAKKQINIAAAGLAQQIDTSAAAPKAGSTVPIVIFNSLNWTRSEPVETSVAFRKPVKAFKIVDSEGKPVAFQLQPAISKNHYSSAKVEIAARNIPSMGYVVYYAVESDKFPAGAIPGKTVGNILENKFYKIVVDPARGGCIKSLYAKYMKKEFINFGVGLGNEIYAIEEIAGSSPWSLNGTGKFWRSGDYPAKSVVVERGNVSDKIIVTNAPHGVKHKKNSVGPAEILPEIVSEIILYKDNTRIDFRTYINGYKAKDILLKVGFPADLKNDAPVFEERFATISRDKNPELFLDVNENKTAGHEYPIYNWVGLSPAASFTFTDENNRTTSQYPLYIGDLVVPQKDQDMLKNANILAEALIKAGVTTNPTTDKNLGANSYYGFRISLGYGMNNEYTHKLLEKLGESLNQKLEKKVADNGVGYLFIEYKESVTKTPDHRTIPILIVEGKTKGDLEKAIGKFVDSLGNRGDIVLPAGANVTSFKASMDEFGLELIDNGNPGSSIENNNTITLSLMRSSTGFPAGESYSSNWETENWNHSFRYALFPHKGKWNEAGVVRTGYGFNFPLIAVQTGVQKGKLPGKSYSFMDTGSADVIVTSLKPAGYPVAESDEPITGEKEISLRIYNPGIARTEGKVKLNIPVDAVKEADFLDRAGESVENTGGSISVALKQFKIQTYLFELKSDGNLFAQIKPSARLESPINERYWETNEDAAPEGMVPVSIVIEPNGYSEDGKALNVHATVASNLKNESISGDIKFDLPEGTTVSGDTKYNLRPQDVKTVDLKIGGLNPEKLMKQYISAKINCNGREYEDTLTFSNWKVIEGEGAGSPDTNADDTAWKTIPLARFWSAAGTRPGTTWYRKKIFIPVGMGDMQILFEKPKDSEIEVYVNGNLERKEKWGLAYRPLINKSVFKLGEENLIAIKFTRNQDADPAWSSSFHGSEALFNKSNAGMVPDAIRVKPGTKGSFKVEITNPFDQEFEGEAVLISPIETWKEGGEYSLIGIGPTTQVFHAKPGGKTTVAFDVNVPVDAMPGPHIAAVKFIYKGMTTYTDTIRIDVE